MMTTKPLISVILCNYNYDQFIAEAIDGVLSQTYTNFELIIVDDGSTDNSRVTISNYTDSRIKTVFKQNGGQASAFNAGFERATGEIICFLDSDDWWKPEKLETVVNWHNFLQGNYAILQHGLDIWSNQKINPYKFTLPVGDCFAEMKRTGNIDFFVPTSGLSFPQKILGQVFPIPTEFRICADAYVMRTAFAFGMVYSIPISMGFYRKHQNTVFRNKYFDYKNFFNIVLFPALNGFYLHKGFDYQLKISERKPYSFYREKLKKMCHKIQNTSLMKTIYKNLKNAKM